MKHTFPVCTALALFGLTAASALAIAPLSQPELVAPAAPSRSAQSNAIPPAPRPSDAKAVAPAQPAAPAKSPVQPVQPQVVQQPSHEPALLLESNDATQTCSSYADGSCSSDVGCGSICGRNWSFCDLLNNDCCLGDAWTLQSCVTPCCDSPKFGGWLEMGYYNNNERLSRSQSDGLAFRDYPNHLNFDQVWLYVEKVADGSDCSTGYGYRFDIMYGVDAQFAQAFGNPGALSGPDRGSWDASFDNGPYGWAMPQAYVEVARGDLSVKIGHFWTPAGYEVVPATGNFFYSHSLTQFNSEPFTHTGVLATYDSSDCMKWYGGWTLGWDTGFDQFGGGSNFLGGFTRKMGDNTSLTFISTVGDLGWRSGSEFGYTQHVVFINDLSSRLQWIVSSDFVHTEGTLADSDFQNQDYGLTNYLIYKLNDCWSAGGRFEWWKSNNVTGFSDSFQELTGGLNYHANANLVVRPEIRYDFTNEGAATGGYNQTFFGIDAVFTF